MHLYDYTHDHSQTVPINQGGGCLTFYSLPFIAALLISGILTLFWFQITPATPVEGKTILPQESNQEESKQVAETNSELAPLFTPEIHHWSDEIHQWSDNWDLEPNLIATVMQIESCGDPHARSIAGAMGLFQVMPFHFGSNEDPYDPQTNATRGMDYLRRSIESHAGDIRLGFAGYNAGIQGSKRSESIWPSETIRYVYWAEGIYHDAQRGKKESETLNEWLSKGGTSLCSQAHKRLALE